jgi:hypothetical protein
MERNAPTVVGGVFEVGVGVPDIAAAAAYWKLFGYREGETGALPAKTSTTLYGVDSGLASLRLRHQNADHGLVRLMAWERPTGDGLGFVPIRAEGNRWTVAKTSNAMEVANHAAMYEREGAAIAYNEPRFNPRTFGASPVPFRDPQMGLRQFHVFMPHSRQVVMQQFGFDMPLYGEINPSCLFQSSQVTHFGICIYHDDPSPFDFYDEVLGLKRSAEHEYVANKNDPPAQTIPLEDGEVMYHSDIDDPRSGSALDEQRSGRLRTFRFTTKSVSEDVFALSRPGNLGYSLYTYRVDDLGHMHARVKGSAATEVTEIHADEFDRPAFSLVAPDGYFWTLMAA